MKPGTNSQHQPPVWQKATRTRRVLQWLWHSPTLTAWGALSARMMSLILVLPLVLHTFQVEEVRFWFMLNTLLILNMLCDAGFSPTFTRIYAYAMGGASTDELGQQDSRERQDRGSANWETVRVVSETCQRAYFLLALFYCLCIAIFGTWAVAPLIPALPSPSVGWWSWTIMLLAQPVGFLGGKFNAYLLGTNLVALNQRFTMVISLITAGAMVVMLVLEGGLLELVLVSQLSVIAMYMGGRVLSRSVHDQRYRDSLLGSYHPVVWQAVWPRAWRSALGHYFLVGTTQLTGLLYARSASAESGATYLLALRLMSAWSQVADAPFYTKLPYLSRLRGEGEITRLVEVAGRGMRMSLFVFVTGVLGFGILGEAFLNTIGKEVGAPPRGLWLLLGVAIFFQRYGAMHLQLFTTTNRIMWHWLAAAAGLVFLGLSYALLPTFDYYAFPIGLLAAYGLVYAPWSALLSYQSLPLSFWRHERITGVPALLLLLAGTVVLYLVLPPPNA